jgi:hypothetical protein
LKKSRLKRKSKSEIRRVQDALWQECRRIIKKRYGNTCYTCGKTGLEGANWQIGHLIPKAALGAYLKYDLRVLRPQCYHCNINLGGNGATFLRRIEEEEGRGLVENIFLDRQRIVKAQDHYEKLLKEYKEIME